MSDAKKKSFKAILVGATGVTGKYLLAELLKVKEFTHIVTLGRRKAEVPYDVKGISLEDEENSGRLQQVVIDMENLNSESVKKYFVGQDVFFTCLGTTRKDAGSAENFKRIDYGYNYSLAQIAKESGVRLYSQMSTSGANKDSFWLYLNSKGKLEWDCGLLNFPQYSIFRPSFLDRQDKKRLLEKFAGFFVTPISCQTVAQAMVVDALMKLHSQLPESSEQTIYENSQIYKMSLAYLSKFYA
ncbi:uncharacterized protein LOC100201769 isoform X4 [Hydra vulgaris]|uniref:Protein HTATIP2 n=1 Tax=Hydra vulgaris TaxID=6087 RepID=A0ABM4DD68_HYDVU